MSRTGVMTGECTARGRMPLRAKKFVLLLVIATLHASITAAEDKVGGELRAWAKAQGAQVNHWCTELVMTYAGAVQQ